MAAGAGLEHTQSVIEWIVMRHVPEVITVAIELPARSWWWLRWRDSLQRGWSLL